MINRWFISLILLALSLCADVKLYAPATFIQNEPLVFELEASGKDIVFPNIDTIDGYPVQKAGTSNQITIINGKQSKTVNKKFLLYPSSTLTLPSFEVLIDSKTYTTPSKTIVMQKAKKTNNQNFDFKVQADKDVAYVGEPIVLDYTFEYKKDDKILDLGLTNLTFEHFWYKKIGDAQTKEKDDTIIQTLKYVLFPQKEGQLHLNPAKVIATMMDVTQQYTFFQRPTKQLSIYSNALDFDVKALPQGVQLVGAFTLSSSLDKKSVITGEAVSFTIHIEGVGNLEDMPALNLDIPNATVYANDATTSFSFEQEEYRSTYSKTFSIVSDESFTIPAVKIPYFSVNKNRIEYLKTNEYAIEVVNVKKKAKPLLQKAEPLNKPVEVKESQKIQSGWLYFVYGVLSTLLIAAILLWIKKRGSKQYKETPLQKRVKSAKTAQELIRILVPYLSKDEQLDAIIFELEKSDELDIKIKKKEIIKILKLNF